MDAFGRGDVDALSHRWETVGLFPGPGGKLATPREAFGDYCVTLVNFYRGQDVVRPSGQLLSASEIDFSEARIADELQGERVELFAEWEHGYITRRSNQWCVLPAIANGEMTAWAARGAQI